MPGIVGIISREPAAECRRRLAAMVKSMQHEPYYRIGDVRGARDGRLRWLGGASRFVCGSRVWQRATTARSISCLPVNVFSEPDTFAVCAATNGSARTGWSS